MSGPISEQLLTLAAAATIFAVMFDLGLGIVVGEFRWLWRHPGLLARGLFCVLVAVPALALAVARMVDLPRAAEIGMVLMAISPGAPVALRRSLDAGGHRSFAPALQILVALLAVVAMPLWVAALEEVYAGRATAAPWELAKQVFVAQLLPLGVGMAIRAATPAGAAWLEPKFARVAKLLLLALTILVLIDVWQVVVGAGLRVALSIVLVTALALAVGHRLGGPEPATRTAVAICSAARNAGLALLVATLNHAPPAIVATVMAYLVISAFTVLAYVAWRRRADGAAVSMGR
jgi:BASS family bile acid:Na+ symporter